MRRLCKCGCGKEFNTYDKYGRIREFVHGHNMRNRRVFKVNRIPTDIKLPLLCKCGCGKEIEIKSHHRRTGLPMFIHGHNRKGCSPANKGKLGIYKHSNTIRKRMSRLQMGRNNSMFGKIIKRTEVTKEKLRNIAIKRIENQKFNGLPMMPSIGKYETSILDNLEKCFGYTILRQHKVSGYFLDGYCPMLNLAIEIDEPYHKKPEQLSKDVLRQQNIKNSLNCTFLRLDIGDII